MSAPEFTPKVGDTVFSEDGRQAEYVALREEGHIVMPLYREADDEFDSQPWPGEPQMWLEVFAKAPVPVVDQDVAEATAELQRLQTQVSEEYQKLDTMRRERAELSRDQHAIRLRLKENEALRNIDAFLLGKITHFVIANKVPEIKTFEQAIERNKEYGGKELRLLGLFGDPKRDVCWRTTMYGDGSGSMTDVVPCLSLEEAQDRAKAMLVAVTFPYMRGHPGDARYYGPDAMKLASELGLTVPDDVATTIKNAAAEVAAAYLERMRRESGDQAVKLKLAEEAAIAAGVPLEGGAA